MSIGGRKLSRVRAIRWRAALSFLGVTMLTTSPIDAGDDSYQRGVAEYQSKHYAEAANFLDAAIAEADAGADVFYYAALAHEQLKHYKYAGRLYQTVIEQFPKSQACVLAQTALKRPEFLDMLSPFALSGRNSNLDSLPRETYINFVNRNGTLIIDGSINDRPVKMCFDTGAATCCCSLRSLEQLGIAKPTGKPDIYVAGVGSTEKIPGWKMFVTLSVGRIVRQKFPIFVSTLDLPFPLLGQNFYRDFQYTIDKSNGSIAFKRIATDKVTNVATPTKTLVTVNSSGKYEYAVPFRMEGQAVVVIAKINGQECPVQFDTGASICMFSTNQLNAVGGGTYTGHKVPLTGAGGTTTSRLYEVGNIELGPVTRPIVVAVTDQARLRYPLLGQNFFKDLQYTIDYPNHVIRFER